ncbi:MAG: hypothetical protein ACRDRH_11435 [Pseudonocardia sp.]
MSAHFEIQARLLERRDGTYVRDEVRLARANTLDNAVRSARTFTADGFTVWIYRVEPGSGMTPAYHLARTLHPKQRVAGPSRPRGETTTHRPSGRRVT